MRVLVAQSCSVDVVTLQVNPTTSVPARDCARHCINLPGVLVVTVVVAVQVLVPILKIGARWFGSIKNKANDPKLVTTVPGRSTKYYKDRGLFDGILLGTPHD